MKCSKKKPSLGIGQVAILQSKVMKSIVVQKYWSDGVKTGYLAVEKYSLASSMKKRKAINSRSSGFSKKFEEF